MHDNGWSKDLTVEVDGHGVVSHTGSAALRLLADNTGLTGGLSRALAHRGFIPVHDRGRVLGDLAVCIADGGRVLSDLAALRDQAELYGPVASDPTVWRTLLQEVTTRFPDVSPGDTTYASAADPSQALRRAMAAHGEHEARPGQADPNWWAGTPWDMVVHGGGGPGRSCQRATMT